VRNASIFPWIDDPAEQRDVLLEGLQFSPRFLLAAYSTGWFPWPHEEQEHLWVCNYERMLVLPPQSFHRSRRLGRQLRQGGLSLSFDLAFAQVVDRCAEIRREEQEGTWITPELVLGFEELHSMGLAHSVEVWRGDALVGGLYGLSLGNMMCGESMFHEESGASKVAMAALCAHLEHWGFGFLDCQVHTDHLESLGARCLERPLFLEQLRAALQHPHRRGPWRVEPSVLATLNLEEKLPAPPAPGREGVRSE